MKHFFSGYKSLFQEPCRALLSLGDEAPADCPGIQEQTLLPHPQPIYSIYPNYSAF